MQSKAPANAPHLVWSGRFLEQLLVWAVSGFLVAFGMMVGGTAHHTSLEFFDVFGAVTPGFGMGLFWVFISALAPGFIMWHVIPKRARPFFASEYHVPTSTTIDATLIGGSLLFGAGWTLGGFCPGPSVAAMMSGHPDYVSFSFGLWLGYVATHWLRRREEKEDWTLTLLLGTIPFVFLWLGPYIVGPNPPYAPTWPIHRSILGGLMIGLAAAILMLGNGRVLGISGIWRRILAPNDPRERYVELVFFSSFLLGTYFSFYWVPDAFSGAPLHDRHLILRCLGGIMVGSGTDLANGCTSGHGVCGIPRFSIRSIVAVSLFMSTAFATVPLWHYVVKVSGL